MARFRRCGDLGRVLYFGHTDKVCLTAESRVDMLSLTASPRSCRGCFASVCAPSTLRHVTPALAGQVRLGPQVSRAS